MIVAIAGTCRLGRALAERLRAAGRTVIPLPNAVGRLPGVDAVVSFRPSMTRTLVDRMLDLPRRPAAFLCASSLAYYGRRPGEVLDESSGPGGGPFAELWRAREAEARAVEAVGIRVVLLRLGRVLRADEPLGDRPWIGLDDALRLITFALERDDVRGPLNVVAPDFQRLRPAVAAARGFAFHWEAL